MVPPDSSGTMERSSSSRGGSSISRRRPPTRRASSSRSTRSGLSRSEDDGEDTAFATGSFASDAFAPNDRSKLQPSSSSDSLPRQRDRRSQLTKSQSVRQHSAPTRSLSDRCKDLARTRSVSGEHLKRVPSRTKSGDGLLPPSSRGLSRSNSRRLPARSRSDAQLLSMPGRLERHESMKALYRTNPEDGNEFGAGSHSHHGSTTLSNHSDDSMRRRLPRRSHSIEGGPLVGIMEPAEPSRSAGGGENEELDSKAHVRYLQKRASKQDEIMKLAQSMKERFQEEREQQRLAEEEILRQQEREAQGESSYDSEDDQPMAMRSKKSALEQLTRAVRKTAGVTKSAAKGGVNAVRDPKRAAKRVGHLSKDVGKATIKTVLDPKKAAINVGKVTKNVTVGSAKVGAGFTKGVAKGTYGATKTVVKGSARATTSVAKGTVKGAGKVVKGTARAITGKGSSAVAGDVFAQYDAKNLADRNQSSLFDRVSVLVDADQCNEDEKADGAALGGAGAPLRAASVLMPTNIISNSRSAGSWDV